MLALLLPILFTWGRLEIFLQAPLHLTFPNSSHHLTTAYPHIDKASFNFRVIKFFSNYLVGRRTQYFWNSFSSPLFNIDIRVGQGSVLSSILSALYLTPFLHILENHLKNLKISVSILSFINNGLLVA